LIEIFLYLSSPFTIIATPFWTFSLADPLLNYNTHTLWEICTTTGIIIESGLNYIIMSNWLINNLIINLQKTRQFGLRCADWNKNIFFQTGL